VKLTADRVRRLNLPSDKSEALFFDEDLPGFGVRLRAGGSRTWICQYRFGSLQRRFTLGSTVQIPADKARATAKTMLAKVELGKDPQAERHAAHKSAADTFGMLVDRYLKAKKGLRSIDEVERHLEKHLAPLHKRSVHDLTRAEVSRRLSDIAESNGPIAANRARANGMAMFSWGMREGLCDANPFLGTNKADEGGPRERVLTVPELVDIWNACRDDDHGRICKLLILTLQRREEVGGMPFSEIDTEKRIWALPGSRTKNGRPHEVWLSDLALEVIASAPRREGRVHVFGDSKETSFSGWSKSKANLDERINKNRASRKLGAIEPWRMHDLRRTGATMMAEMGVLPHVVEAVLNHVSGSKAGIAGVYNLAAYSKEKRQALDMWAAHVDALIAGKPASNVVSLAATS
jgi:integrase